MKIHIRLAVGLACLMPASAGLLIAARPADLSARPVQPRGDYQEYPVAVGSHPHDVAPAVDGGIWYTSQFSGELGWLDPVNGDVDLIPLGPGSMPHGVHFDPVSETFESFPLPSGNAKVRQLLGRPGEVWGAESAVDQIVLLRTGSEAAPPIFLPLLHR